MQEGVGARYLLLAESFEADYSPDDEVSERLRSVDVDPAELTFAIFSHLHFDHCGAAELLPNARLICRRAEWESGHHPKLIEHEVYKPEDFDLV
ncbi:MBL fold metallo-hydrolase [Candidatus Poriferisodalis sp.]|uniref:MBL fold metallo-hydrolase n=1 Tax=Candidatus Poriferisodalis sp. TaxID=3101277 RepID=UPI003B01FB9A